MMREGRVGTVGTRHDPKRSDQSDPLKTIFCPRSLCFRKVRPTGSEGEPQKPRLRGFLESRFFSRFLPKKDVVLGTTIRVSKPRLQRLRLSAVKPDSWAGFLAGLQRWTLRG